MKRILSVCFIVLTFIAVTVAADFWSSKPYTKWSQADATRLLTNSPWAKTTTMRTGTVSGRGGIQNIAEAQDAPLIQYAVSIRSAEPVRQANARMAYITRKYDKMDDAAKKEFDDKWNKYLATKFPDTLVTAVNYESNVPDIDRQLTNYFQAQSLDTIKATTALILPNGTRVEPTAFAAGGHELQIAFPRPELAPDASFSIEFKHPDMPDQPSRRISSKFSLKDMVFNGTPAY